MTSTCPGTKGQCTKAWRTHETFSQSRWHDHPDWSELLIQTFFYVKQDTIGLALAIYLKLGNYGKPSNVWFVPEAVSFYPFTRHSFIIFGAICCFELKHWCGGTMTLFGNNGTYIPKLLFPLQCCERHVNHCYGNFVRMT